MVAFINELMKMSARGMVIILVVMVVRLLLKKLGIGHKYIVALWMMAFLYLVIPWKISLSVGFWGSTPVPDGIWADMDSEKGVDNAGYNGVGSNLNDINVIGGSGDGYVEDVINISNTAGTFSSAHSERDTAGGSVMQALGAKEEAAISMGSTGQDGAAPNGLRNAGSFIRGNRKLFASLWVAGLILFSGHMLYSYLTLRKKLLLSVPYRDNIWWAEKITMPMVFGLIRPRIYLPVGLEGESLFFVIAHEEMHVRRRDGLLKMAAYVICLIHWFNPVIWTAYILLGSDLEKACDEEVIGGMEKEKRKEYAYALIHIAAGAGTGKRRVFVAPIGFAEGNLKSRVKNVMKYKYTLPGLGVVVTVLIIALSALFLTEAKEQEPAEPQGLENLTGGNGEQGDSERLVGENKTQGNEEGLGTPENSGEELPFFYTEDPAGLDHIRERTVSSLSIEDCYSTNRRTPGNHFYIDESGVLWGTGSNEYGQLGTGTYSYEEYHEEPVRIAEHVVSVDVSENSYFCIYLTESGELYGVGLNFAGLLLGKGSENVTYNAAHYHRVAEPVLLMENVVYAKAGRMCIVALQGDGSAYWWGEYSSTTLSHPCAYEDYWRLDEEGANPAKMLVSEPKKIMDDCVYITTGTHTGAAINGAGELYTWGLNIFGQCGTPVTEDDYIRTPVKVMDGVKMAWVGRIGFNSSGDHVSDDDYIHVNSIVNYASNTFILKEDNTLMAVGLNLGDKEKVTELTGDLRESQTHQYGDSFVPVRAIEYSSELSLRELRNLDFGMSVEEVEEILNNSVFSEIHRVTADGLQRIWDVHSRYCCCFDSDDRMESILIQEGGSRDGRFARHMSVSELQEAVRNAGGELTEGTDGDYFYEDEEQQIKYVFHTFKGAVVTLEETALD